MGETNIATGPLPIRAEPRTEAAAMTMNGEVTKKMEMGVKEEKAPRNECGVVHSNGQPEKKGAYPQQVLPCVTWNRC